MRTEWAWERKRRAGTEVEAVTESELRVLLSVCVRERGRRARIETAAGAALPKNCLYLTALLAAVEDKSNVRRLHQTLNNI